MRSREGDTRVSLARARFFLRPFTSLAPATQARARHTHYIWSTKSCGLYRSHDTLRERYTADPNIVGVRII